MLPITSIFTPEQCRVDLPTNLLQLQIPQRREHKHRPGNTDPDTQVRAVRANHPGNRANIPYLVHADDRTRPSDQERSQSSKAEGQLGPVSPGIPIKAAGAAEDEVFFEGDGKIDGYPITHQGQEVFEDIVEVVPAT